MGSLYPRCSGCYKEKKKKAFLSEKFPVICLLFLVEIAKYAFSSHCVYSSIEICMSLYASFGLVVLVVLYPSFKCFLVPLGWAFKSFSFDAPSSCWCLLKVTAKDHTRAMTPQKGSNMPENTCSHNMWATDPPNFLGILKLIALLLCFLF